MHNNHSRISLILLSLLIFSCTQEPASVVVHHTTSPAKPGFVSSNPYKVTVQKGDTLYSLSKKNNVEIRSVIEANRMRPPYILIPGQTVKLPKATFHIVNETDNLYAISRSYGVDISRLAQKNNISPPYNLEKGQKLLLPSPAENDSSENAFTKNIKYDYGTNPASVSSSSVASSDLAPLDGKQVKSTVNADEEQSPFANQIEASNTKKNQDVAVFDDSEESPFAYKSAKEITSSSKQISPDSTKKTNNIKKTTSQPKQKIELFADDNENIVPKSSAKPVAKMKEDNSFGDTYVSPKSSPKQEVSAGKVNFSWPLSGKIISKFGPKKGGLYNDGINIEAREGAPVKAVADGDVVYAGNELRGYGNMLLIKHNNGYLTAYAHTNDFLVKKGDAIKKGQVIAHVGQTGHVSSPQLHFSMRQGRKAIDPEKYLPAVL